jgi:hypothetical protein
LTCWLQGIPPGWFLSFVYPGTILHQVLVLKQLMDLIQDSHHLLRLFPY